MNKKISVRLIFVVVSFVVVVVVFQRKSCLFWHNFFFFPEKDVIQKSFFDGKTVNVLGRA